MATVYIAFAPKVSWWVWPALQCIGWYCRFTRTTPDIDKITAFLMHGIKLRSV